ncbi:TnsA endonuclease N-terminal domain-containing protein [Bradyrhizobium sp. CCBAU 45394]|uniref:TnsA endonuclease N-terminal domain-containing protein n=1 Tax=Bradyrhizobium sp. CCBAU 45394 TaxID=1325087 RepID=UPI002303B4D7|nr:TnsA endonuclease N-terminal domain-containing protein [Bradyrhizobium sp. CCBAU 45394]
MAEHESALERDFVTLASFMDASAVVTAQPVTIHFQHEGRRRRYTPDFRADSGDDHCEIVEIKCRPDLRAGCSAFGRPFAAARNWAHCNGARLRIATERRIRYRQLDNATRLLPLRSAPVDTVLAERAVAHACARAVSFGDLIDALPISREASLAVVSRLIARGALIVDLTMPITSKSRVTAGAFPRVDCREYSVVKYSSIDLSRIHGDTGDTGAEFDKVPTGCRPVSGGTRPPCRYRPHVHQFD